MKAKLCILTLVGLVAGSLAGLAQTTPSAGEPPATTPSVTATNDAAQPEPAAATAPAQTSDAATNATATADAATSAATTGDAAQAAAPAKPAATAEAPAEAAPTLLAANNAAQPAAPAQAATDSAAAATATNAAPLPDGVISQIVMDDVPLTDAIKNLARQAGLNYLLDPKVSFGQVGPDGKMTAQPTISIRWEKVTAEQALAALLNTYNLQLVEDPKSKIARITVKDPLAPDPLVTKVIQLKYSSTSNMVAAVQNTLTDKRSKVVPDMRTSQLVILATEKELVDVEQLVARLDTRTKQVLIEARLMETTINPHTDKGVDWSGTLANQQVAFGNNFSGPLLNTAGPLLLANTTKGFTPGTFFLNADGVRAAISFLNTYGETKTLSSPRTVTLDNELASIEVGTMFPIVNTTAGTANTTGGSTVSYSNLTVRLDVTPRISANDFVNLKIVPRVIRLGVPVDSVVGGLKSTVDSFLVRSLQTSVLIPSGNTLVMGGLVDDAVTINNIKVPVLGDIPGLGFLFRHDSKDRQRDNLNIFITPTIVGDEDFQPTKTDFLKTKVPTNDSLEGEWSSWDSGKPRDWSKPEPSGNYSDPK